MMDIETLTERINFHAGKGDAFVFAINYDCTEGFFLLDPMEQTEVFWEMDGIGNARKFSFNGPHGSRFQAHPMSEECYASMFDTIQRHLHRGDTFLANLTGMTPVETDYSLEEIFLRSTSRFRILYPGKFVCFSPEIFVDISADGTIRTHPMKGTISGLVEDAANKILSNYKEYAEHCTIVDFMRSELSRIARNVHVKRFRYIDTLVSSKGPVLQVSSEIRGSLEEGWRNRLGGLLLQILPAGSISGAPKQATLQAIHEAENHDRGFYTGIFGYFDGQALRTCVLIRFIEQREESLFFHSGGGITINSDCQEEYRELWDKVYVPWQ